MSTFLHPEGKFALQYPSTWSVDEYYSSIMFHGNSVTVSPSPSAGFDSWYNVNIPNMTVYVTYSDKMVFAQSDEE